MGNINDDDDNNNNDSNDNIIIKVSYNYHKKNLPESFEAFFIKLYDFDNFIRRRLTDQNKITFAIKYLPMSHLR